MVAGQEMTGHDCFPEGSDSALAQRERDNGKTPDGGFLHRRSGSPGRSAVPLALPCAAAPRDLKGETRMGLARLLRGSRDRGEMSELREEIGRLKHENMMLRLDRQRPTALGQVAEHLQALAAAQSHPASSADRTALDERVPDGTVPDGATRNSSEEVDEAHHVLAQAQALRSALLDVLQTLRVSAAQLERQLVTGRSSSEVDRRVLTGRRATDVARADLDAELADLGEAFEQPSVVPTQRRS